MAQAGNMPPQVSYTDFYIKNEFNYDQSYKALVDKTLHIRNGEYKHIIIFDIFLNDILNYKYFDFTGIACYCRCTTVTKNHYHLIGKWTVSMKTIQRFFKQLYTKYNIQVKQGSNFAYKTLTITDFQHLITTVFYISRQQKVHLNSNDLNQFLYGSTCPTKHESFIPFGYTPLTQYSTEKGKEKQLWDNIKKYLNELGHNNLVEDMIIKYNKYVEKRNKERAERRNKFLMGAQADAILNYTGGPITLRAESSEQNIEYIEQRKLRYGAEMAQISKEIEQLNETIQRESEIGPILKKYGVRRSPISRLQEMVQEKQHKRDSKLLSEAALISRLQKEQRRALWREQQRKVTSSKAFDDSSMDNWDA